MEYRAAPPDDVIVQVNAAAVATVDERISTCQITEEEGGVVGHEQVPVGWLAHRSFSQSYRTRHRNPMVRYERHESTCICACRLINPIQPKLLYPVCI
jgi:hypothetical protein